MSSAGNPYVNLNGPAALPYDLQLAQFQRQQKMADALRQEASEPIPVQTGGGQPAPISWVSVLAKALQGAGASAKEGRVDSQLKQLGAQDTDSAQALIRQLTQGTNQVGAPSMPSMPTQISATTPQLPGAPAPAQQAPANVQLPGTAGGQMQSAPPSMQDQLAAVLAARGGPQTQMIQQAMLPQIMGRQNMDYQHQLNRDDKQWENTLPMSTAAQQQITAQGQQAQQNSRFTNQLPETAYQQAQIGIERGKLGEERRYHDLMMGNGLGGDDPAVKAGFAAVTSGAVPGVQSLPKRLQIPVMELMNNSPTAVYAPIAARRFGMASNSIVGPLMKLPQYELTANGLPYIQRIQAALTKPGSVSDQELLDSFTKLSTSGNAITDAQVRIITDGKSLSDWASTVGQKLQSGGVLSNDQRKQINEIANRTYAKYREGYQPLYDEATSKLTAAGIPKPFWTIPDLNKLNAAQTGGGGTASGTNIAPAGTKAVGPGGKTLTSDGKGGWN